MLRTNTPNGSAVSQGADLMNQMPVPQAAMWSNTTQTQNPHAKALACQERRSGGGDVSGFIAGFPGDLV
jgi:hypothetical protein